jgi:heterodisulfide reductase subunit A-like polyferredoxin
MLLICQVPGLEASQQLGFQVNVVEKHESVGGRCSVMNKDDHVSLLHVSSSSMKELILVAI